MDDCRYFEELISASVDGELTQDEQRALKEHLEGCENCRLYRQALLSIQNTSELPPPPADLSARIMDAVHAAAPKKKAKIIPFPRGVRSLAAAAAVMALVLWAGARMLTPKVNTVESAAAQSEARSFSAAAAPAAGIAKAESEEAAAENGPTMMTFGTAENAAFDAAPIPFVLRSADGREWQGEDCFPLFVIGQETKKPVPDRAPDYTVLDAEGAPLWELWEEGKAVLFRPSEGETLYSENAQTFWDALGVKPAAE